MFKILLEWSRIHWILLNVGCLVLTFNNYFIFCYGKTFFTRFTAIYRGKYKIKKILCFFRCHVHFFFLTWLLEWISCNQDKTHLHAPLSAPSPLDRCGSVADWYTQGKLLCSKSFSQVRHLYLWTLRLLVNYLLHIVKKSIYFTSCHYIWIRFFCWFMYLYFN